MLIQCLDVAGVEAYLIGLRLPYKSGLKSDSCPYAKWIGPKDKELAMKQVTAGSSHRKSIRLLDAWFKITAPLYWWKQMDTYRSGVDKVSESTMHCLMKDPIKESHFEWQLANYPKKKELLEELEKLRKAGDFKTLNALLPQSYLQTRVLKCSYEALHKIYEERKTHKLKEWQILCQELEKLPFSYLITEKDDFKEYDQEKEKNNQSQAIG